MRRMIQLSILMLSIFLVVACTGQREPDVLRLATTTSTADSGLLKAILPDFEAQNHARVDVVAVGTGQALELGKAGNADVVLVHARAKEDEFITAGNGLYRADVMYNDFILVGPPNDSAAIKGKESVIAALKAIAAAKALFASRGDDSGTHTKELALWKKAEITPAPASDDWYKSLGQGMGDTLLFANEKGAYTLTDRGTYLSMQDKLPNLQILTGGKTVAENKEKDLLNPYGVIPVHPNKGKINNKLAEEFVKWLTAAKTQEKIGQFGVDKFGQPLFYPSAKK